MNRFVWLVCAAAMFLASPIFSDAREEKTPRPAAWAEPLSVKGLPNLHKVSDRLYRSAQPEETGVKALKTLGVKTVVSLRANHSDEPLLKGLDVSYTSIPIDTWDLEEKHVVEFLKIVTDPARTPVLVHCQHGADRTGTLCAVYRIAVQGWTKDEAIREMKDGGYGFHSVWVHLPKWIKKLDIEAVRKKAGLSQNTLGMTKKMEKMPTQ